MQQWKSFKIAPKDGTPVIFWLSSDTLEDTTANFYYYDGQWYWECDDSPLKRPDLVNGWMLYPQPPARKKKAKRPNPTTRAVFRETTNRMLKKSSSGVLASLRGSTYRSVRLAPSLAAALLDGLFEHSEM